jgi:DNA-binding CsgD family transcriptional regulator
MERVISEIEEQILRLHHHDFAGLSIDDTAAKLGITVDEVKTHLRHIKKVAPQMFPILTQRQRAIIMMYDQHASRKAISEALGISAALLSKEVAFLRRHGFLFNRVMSQYDPKIHDGLIKERF